MEFNKGNAHQPNSVPDVPGNYLVCLKSNSILPQMEGVQFCDYKGLRVLYTGISNKSLRKRDIKQHFYGHAGKSTLRKSIGSLLGYTKIARDKNNPENGKTKFTASHESSLTDWMVNNLEFYYKENNNPVQYETGLIQEFNPPLNISKNSNLGNLEFRDKLKSLRTAR